MNLAKKTIPTTKPFNKVTVTVPWWSKACKIAINNKKHAFNPMKRTRDPLDIVIFKRARAKAKLTLNEAKKLSWQNCCFSLSSNNTLGQVWSTLKRFNRQQTDTNIPTLHQNGVTDTIGKHKSNMLATQFYAVSSNDNYSNEFKNNSSNFFFQLAQRLSLQEYQYKDFNAPFCMTELKDSLKTFSNTAVGVDNISTEMLKHMHEHC